MMDNPDTLRRHGLGLHFLSSAKGVGEFDFQPLGGS